jgi:hypothetical protein
MRRIAFVLSLVALVAVLHACAADAPTKPPAGGGGGNSSALSVQLFTSDANPKAGTCTQIEAVVTLNGNPVPDGTSVAFTTDFGTFSQNSLPTVSVVTTSGQAVTALCGPAAGPARVKATATSGGKTSSASLTISFQPSSGTLPFVSSCSPSFADPNAPATITLSGGRFFGTPATSRVQFTANGITRDGLVTDVQSGSVTVQTPQFPELTSPSTLTQITLTLGTNLAQPIVLSLPNCFAFGTSASNVPAITALLPSQGQFPGGTRVTIIGSGFSTQGVQVFFGTAEATVVSTTFSQIVVISPPAPAGSGSGGVPVPVPVFVKNINSGQQNPTPVNFTYTIPIRITSADNLTQRIDLPFTPVTIYGAGFQAPVAVSLAGIAAHVNSVSATEIVVLPGNPLIEGCSDITGPISVVNIDTGDGATSANTLTFTYVVPKPNIQSIVPTNDAGGANTQATITGTGFPLPGNAQVKFGSKIAFIVTGTQGSLTVTIPPGSVTTAPACTPPNGSGALQVVETVDVTVTDVITGCTATAPQAFSYELHCVVPTPAP